MSCVNCNLSTWRGHGWIFRGIAPVLLPGDNYFQTTFKWDREEHGTFPHINIIGSQDRRKQLIIVDHHYLNREYPNQQQQRSNKIDTMTESDSF